LETRRVTLAGITQHPTEEWMVQMARRAVDDIDGALLPVRFVLHDRDSKFCASFRDTLRSAGVQPLSLPARSPNLNAFAERWVRSIKSECLSKLILFGELSLRRAVTQFIEHYHLEHPDQGKGNQLLSLLPFRHHHDMLAASNAMSDSVDCSSLGNHPKAACGSGTVIITDSAPESVITSLAGFAGMRRPHPPGDRTGMPAARRYPPIVSRRMWTAASIRRRDHPSRPSAITLSCPCSRHCSR
jgi:hypothetical protein